MKFMNTINELQKKLTKLRREIQRSEAPTAGESLEDQIRRCNEIFIDGYAKKLDQEMMNELKKAGECNSYCSKCGDRLVQAYESGRMRCPRCLVKEMSGIPDILRGTAGECTKCTKIEAILEERIHGNMPDCQCGICMRVVDVIWPDKEPDSTPDLPLHVRVAKALGKDVNHYDGKWRMMIPHVDAWWRCPAIPDYPNDLVAAMGALEEYCNTHNVDATMRSARYVPPNDRPQLRYSIDLGGMCVGMYPLPRAICEAIVAYAEGK